MPNSRDFIDHLLELARHAGQPTARTMFGGHGLYVDKAIVAIVIDDTLYLKCDATTAPAFEARDLAAFVYTTKDGQRIVMSYRRAPDEVLESPDAMREWIRLAQGVALRVAAAKPVRRPATLKRTPPEP